MDTFYYNHANYFLLYIIICSYVIAYMYYLITLNMYLFILRTINVLLNYIFVVRCCLFKNKKDLNVFLIDGCFCLNPMCVNDNFSHLHICYAVRSPLHSVDALNQVWMYICSRVHTLVPPYGPKLRILRVTSINPRNMFTMCRDCVLNMCARSLPSRFQAENLFL